MHCDTVGIRCPYLPQIAWVAGYGLTDVSESVFGAGFGDFSIGGIDIPSYTKPDRPYRSIPEADLSEHYHWEDILDAETDGYLDED